MTDLPMPTPSTVNEQEVTRILDINKDAERAVASVNWARYITLDSRRKAHRVLDDLGPDEALGENRAHYRKQLMYLIEKEANMDSHVERGAEQFRVVHMPDLDQDIEPGRHHRTERCSEYGWPFDADLIKLTGKWNGRAQGDSHRFNYPQVCFLQKGEAKLQIPKENISMQMTKNAQAAIPANTNFSIEGKGTLLVLRMKSNRMKDTSPELVVGNFHNIGKKQVTIPEGDEFPGYLQECPCGWSRRMWLHERGWGFDTHLTDLGHDVHGEETVARFRGHQHKGTTEAYFGSDIQGDVRMLINGSSVPLRNGTLVLVPNGTMHEVVIPEDGKAEVRIFVGEGGHDDNDFHKENWSKIEH